MPDYNTTVSVTSAVGLILLTHTHTHTQPANQHTEPKHNLLQAPTTVGGGNTAGGKY